VRRLCSQDRLEARPSSAEPVPNQVITPVVSASDSRDVKMAAGER